MKPFFLTTIPKSGTHLLTRFLELAGLQRYPFAERNLVESFERLYFHRHHRRRYNEATGAGIGRRTLREAEARHRAAFEASRRLLSEAPPDVYAFYHVPFDRALAQELRTLGRPMVFLHRDPRDVALSMTHHIQRRRDDRKSAALAALASDDERYAAVVCGRSERNEPLPLLPLSYLYERFEGWLDERDVLTLRYEDIIGPRGGGDTERQYAAYSRFAEHIGLELSQAALVERVDSLYSETGPFFVTGKTRAWEAKLTPRLERAFRGSLGPTIKHWTGEDNWCERFWLWDYLARARRRWPVF